MKCRRVGSWGLNRWQAWLFAGAVFFAPMAGCSSSGPPVAPVKGKVTYDNKPVEGGSITLRPLSVGSGNSKGLLGKPASGVVQADGTFVLTTHKPSDGAVVGKHEISFLPASKPGKPFDPDKPVDYSEKIELSPYAGLVPKEKQVEVKAGQNDFTIELVKPGAAPAAPADAPK